MTDLSRRNWLKAAAGTTMLAGASLTAAKAVDPMPTHWDETFDVVVIGSGFAGLAAAIEARQAGASVCVLEKMRTIGGNSIINGGIMGVPGSPMQKREGLEDSPELMARDMLQEGAGLNHPEKVLHLCQQALPTWEWTIKELGVEWVEERVAQEGGHSVPRCAILKNGSGSGIVLKEQAKLKSMGVTPRTGVLMEHIIRDSDGRVKGVQVREGYRFPKKDSGKVKFIAAKKAVILAHGGFGADVKFRSIQDPKLTEKLGTTCQPGATSEAWREASRIGCHMIQTDWIQCAPWTSPTEKGMGIALFFAQGAAAMFGVWVEDKNGSRFVNELANRKVRADAIMNLLNKGVHCYAIADANGVIPMGISRPGILNKMLERGCVKKYETLEALAEGEKINLEGLKKSIAEWNTAVETGKDPHYDRYVNKKAQKMGTGPWYVSTMVPKVHHCMGGIYTDMKARALDVMTDEPIPGLYAAGESTGGVHGAVRLGSCAVTDCIVYGRIAGQNASKEPSWT